MREHLLILYQRLYYVYLNYQYFVEFHNDLLILNDSDFMNLMNISLGFYSPLNRFCNFNDYIEIINRNKINKNVKWTIPILLTIKKNKNLYEKNKFYPLKYKKKIVGIIKAESFFIALMSIFIFSISIL